MVLYGERDRGHQWTQCMIAYIWLLLPLIPAFWFSEADLSCLASHFSLFTCGFWLWVVYSFFFFFFFLFDDLFLAGPCFAFVSTLAGINLANRLDDVHLGFSFDARSELTFLLGVLVQRPV